MYDKNTKKGFKTKLTQLRDILTNLTVIVLFINRFCCRAKYMVFESILIPFGNLSHKKGIFSNLGQRTMSQIGGSEGI